MTLVLPKQNQSDGIGTIGSSIGCRAAAAWMLEGPFNEVAKIQGLNGVSMLEKMVHWTVFIRGQPDP